CFSGSITYDYNKGGVGEKGDGSPAGVTPGNAGTPGGGGRPGTNSNCPSSGGVSLGPGDPGRPGSPNLAGPQGSDTGVSGGVDGTKDETFRTCPGEGCYLEGPCLDPPPAYGGCITADYCMYPSTGCDGIANNNVGGGCCCPGTPIIIDVLGDGFNLTSPSGG